MRTYPEAHKRSLCHYNVMEEAYIVRCPEDMAYDKANYIISKSWKQY